MSTMLCTLFGHKWSNRGMIKVIDGEEMVGFKCKRCGTERITSFALVSPIRKAVGRLKEDENE